jgi:prepilin-type N-terminal cleavage/methylation domain-containing protein
MLKPKSSKQEQGFTLIEVLVAILIATIFVTVSMQMMVIAAMFKARAQENAEATNWIQEDLENLRYQAANYKSTSLTANANSGNSSITLASSDDFEVNNRLRVGSDPLIYRITSKSGTTLNITPNLGTNQSQGAAVLMTFVPSTSLTANKSSGNSSITIASVDNFAVNDKVQIGTETSSYTINSIVSLTKTLTITPSLRTNKSEGDAVVLSTMCNPTASENGLADGLRDKISGSNLTITTNFVSVSKTSNRTGKVYSLTKTTTLSSDAPYNLLQVRYDVSPTSGGSSIANFYTEVIPNVAFQCP